MDTEKIKFGIMIFFLIVVAGTFFSPLSLSMFSAEDSVLIDGDDVVSYNIINTDEIEIVMDDNTIYTVELGYGDEVVDFTVNSDIYIELERFDTRLFWWDLIINPDPVFPDEYSIGRIIKVPDIGDDNEI